ncbi:unnamed protein product [Plutella xylostella]|uniref:(diamondback moth) hypothetical protein n=1 Tax=Plutella xylostella TaxID=51655 RepID=A0A8S4G9S1_PLUXY|nr:unnamed protein product [Plutella xylostella]
MFLSNGGLLNPFQSGFRSGHSTTTALLKVTEDIRCAMEDRRVTVLVLVDFSNAFNAVDHDLLLAVLRSHKISDPAVSWFSSYLRGRQQAIHCGPSDISDWADLSAGVPQGGILSPLLFSTFINLVTSNLLCSYHLYADDLQIYNQVKLDDLDAGIAGINSDLEEILRWSRSFGISVNPSKCQAIIVGGSRLLSGLDYAAVPPVKFDGRVVPFSATVNDLGLIIDQNLSWDQQLDKVSRKVYASLHSLLRLKKFLPQHTKLALVNSLLLPILDYADVCYLDLTEALLNKLERLLNTCIRFVFGLRKYDHVSQYRAQLKWLPIRDRRNLRILCLLFSILHEPNTPPYLKSMFQFLSDTHTRDLRSSHNSILALPSFHSGFMSDSFAVTAVRLWNDLPDSIRKAPSRNVFKRLTRTHYLSKIVS